MQLSVILDVAIGLVVIWLILSVATIQIQEFFVDLLGWRSTFLKKQILDMFHGQKRVTNILYEHPLIQSLHTPGLFGMKRKPREIPTSVFAKAAVDVFLNIPKLYKETAGGNSFMDVLVNRLIPFVDDFLDGFIGKKPARRNAIHFSAARFMSFKNLESSHKTSIENLKENVSLAEVLGFLAPNLNVEAIEIDKLLSEYQKNVEEWFDASMSKASNLYRKNASIVALVIGIILAYWFNVDSIYITSKLWAEPTLRQAIVAQAGNLSPNDEAGLNSTITKINNLPLPIGWNSESVPGDQREWYLKYAGWFITGLAASQGSPFWFDILRKLGSLKSQQSTDQTRPTQPAPVG